MNSPIQSLWIGDQLSNMEQLAIQSFLRHGHTFHLYVYRPTDGIPSGTVVRDANEILPESRIFRFTNYDSPAGFASFFRYKLLLERGGWWVDTDVVCLRPFRFSTAYAFSSEFAAGAPHPGNCVIKAPAGAPLLRHLWETCERLDPKKLKWGEVGPLLISKAVQEFSLDGLVQPPETFCPIDPPEWESVLDGRIQHKFGERTHAIHLWNELWRRANRDKNASYPRRSLFEKLKRENGVPERSNRLRIRMTQKVRALFRVAGHKSENA